MANGILVIDKSAGWTSQDVAAKLRGVFHERRVGHGGTLDPMATGVLPIFIGRATRAAEFLESAEKEYIAGLCLGVVTDTMEFYAGGEVGVCTMPKKLLAAFTVTEDDLDSISGFARSIEGVKIGVMIREVEDGLGKISLRTEAPYDASAICQRLGGGGHAAAAGASVPGGIAGAKAAILRALAESGVRL